MLKFFVKVWRVFVIRQLISQGGFMKKCFINKFFFFLLLPIVAALFSSQLFAKVTVERDGDNIIYNFSIEGVHQGSITLDGKKFERATLLGAPSKTGILYVKGMPEIPVIRFYVDADKKSDVAVDFSSTKSMTKIAKLAMQLVPSQESAPKIKGFKNLFIQNLAHYKNNAFWPLKSFDVTDAGSINGKRRQLVTVYPYSYNPVLSQYKLRSDFSVIVKSNKFANINKVKAADKKDLFVFIVGKAFKDAESLKSYEQLKRTLGYEVREIVIGQDATTTTEIRKKLQEYYRNELFTLKYAMIVGDSEHVPSPKAANLSKGVTDHYYRAIDTNDYNSDINGPDIGLGRITVKNVAELDKVIAKFVKYYRAAFADQKWLKNWAYIATDDRYQIAEGSHNYAMDTFTKARGYTGIFPNNPELGGDQLYAITHKVSDAKVVSTLNLGRGLINYSGHGATTYWAGPTVDQNNVRSLNHQDALPFVISNACITGQFTIDESFGETWIKHPNGAILYLGSMDSSYWDEDDVMERRMYHQIFEYNKLAFNDIIDYSLSEVWRRYGGENRSKYYWETYVTFGDPSIHLRTEEVKNVTLSGPAKFIFGSDSLEYKVTDISGNPVKNVRVGVLSTSGKFIDGAYTDETGVARFVPRNIDVGEKLIVSIYGDNIAYQSFDIDVISPNFPYISIMGINLHQDVAHNLQIGESSSLDVSIENVSLVEVNNIHFRAEVVKGDIRFEQLESDFSGIINPGEIFKIEDIMPFTLGPDTTGDQVVFNLYWTIGENTGVKTFIAKVDRALISLGSYKFENGVGMGPGERGGIIANIKNLGNLPLQNLNLRPVAGSCIITTEGEVGVANLDVNNSADLSPIYVTVDPNCKNSDMATVNFVGEYQGALAVEKVNFSLVFEIGGIGSYVYEKDSIYQKIIDNQEIVHQFEVSSIEQIKSLAFSVKITHSYRSDLTLTLVSPDGTNIVLMDREGGSNDNVDAIFDSKGLLKDLVGTSALGIWKFKVKDNGYGDTGTLDYVKFDVTGFVKR